MGRYVSSAEFFARYPAAIRVSSITNVDTHHIYYAEYELDRRLASVFTPPFSNNNITAKDLSMDLAYLRVGNFKDEARENFKEEIDARIQALIDGTDVMQISDGTTLTSIGGTLYSTTEDYHPTFGMGSTLDMRVDSSQTYAEENARD